MKLQLMPTKNYYLLLFHVFLKTGLFQGYFTSENNWSRFLQVGCLSCDLNNSVKVTQGIYHNEYHPLASLSDP